MTIEASELHVSSLKEKKLLEKGTKITFFSTRENGLLPFIFQEDNLGFYSEIRSLSKKMGLPENFPDSWRAFVDSSKRSLKCFLLLNGNEYSSIITAQSTKMKKE